METGQHIDFILTQNTTINDVLYKKGTNVTGEILEISDSSFGEAKKVKIGNFVINPDVKLEGQIEVSGKDRTFLTTPFLIILLPIALVASIPVICAYNIKGGHAKLEPLDVYSIKNDFKEDDSSRDLKNLKKDVKNILSN